MQEVLDRTRSKRPQAIPDEKDLGKLHLRIDKYHRLINDTETIEKLYNGAEYTRLMILQKRRNEEIMRKILERQLTSDEKDLAWHNEARGRLRESFLMLDALSDLGNVKTELKTKRKGLIATAQRWGNRFKRNKENE